ncbi:uncharacterized protein N7496_000013 [Penicillium cataractarum]|uniref:Ig-like domain-containing protein n=1 Tax=Penicillium cataractarum TaxID=2100454 RepID=A0A9W9VTL8_9EURO|nr:uncharacterized protein N7496_000013 [Penicillium cataractarum]KAJ5388945.1 hypothetical protein N7496_000013 [Penicillium cataractarum]
MRASFFLAAALAALGVQADDSSSTIVGYFSPPWDAGLLQYGGWTSTAASLVAINTKAATYHVGCLKDAPKTDCDYPESWTIIQGPETVSFTGKYIATTSDKTTSYDITVTQSYECSLKSSTESASCTMSAGMSGSLDGGKYESSTSSKATYTTAPISNSYYQLTVTGGLSKLTTAQTTTTTGGAVAGPAGAMITAAPVVAAAMAALL